jgi:ribosomal protein S3AE
MPNELCILCGEETNVDVNTHVDYRIGYIEGAGQCCLSCYNNTRFNGNIESDYVAKIMKRRTSLVTISVDDILNTPNDMELGAKIRQKYWDLEK